MTTARIRLVRLLFAAVAAGLLLAGAGCRTVYNVKIDAINDQTKPLGTSYRLEMHDPTANQDEKTGRLAEEYVRAALGSRGMYEVPPNVTPDMVIFAEYGVGPGQMKIVYAAPMPTMGSGPLGSTPGGGSAKPTMVYEKFIKLSARTPTAATATRAAPAANPSRSTRAARGQRPARPTRGDELWNIEVSVEDTKKDLAPYLEVLAAMSVDYIGGNTGEEKYVRVESGAPEAKLDRRMPLPTPPGG